jgi:hypothetical protein
VRPEPDPAADPAEARPIDGPTPENPAPDGPTPENPAPAGPEPGTARHEPPPGLRAQFGATRLAAIGFVRAHIDLAKAELDDIKGEVGRAAALGGLALAVVLFASLLAGIGGILFTGEWIFGSIGWGVLLGVELLLAIAVTAVLVALRVPGLGKDVALAFVLGLVVALVLGFELPNRLFTLIGDAALPGVDPAVRPLLAGVALLAILGALAGAVTGARLAGGAGGLVGGLVGGALAGALTGAFLAISFGLRVGVALGFAVFYVAWPALMGLRTQRQGIDMEQLKARFYPATTIETTKESIEWAKARFPGGPR